MSIPVGEPQTPPPEATVDRPAGTDPVPGPEPGSELPQKPVRAPWTARFSGQRSRRATYAVLVLIGVELGMIGAFLSLQVLHPLGLSVPVGPVFGVLGNLLVGFWAVRITGNRSAGVAPALGWLAAVLLLSTSRSEGDLVITNSGRGVAFLLLGALAWAAAAAGSRLALPAQHG